MTYVVLNPSHRLGIFVAVNRVNFPMFEGIEKSVHNLAVELSPGE
jgi:hypothetical protein